MGSCRVQNDAAEKAKKIKKDFKTMQAMLKRVVNYGDSSHYMVEERSA